MFSGKYCKIFKNTYFEEHLQKATSEVAMDWKTTNIPIFNYLWQFKYMNHWTKVRTVLEEYIVLFVKLGNVAFKYFYNISVASKSGVNIEVYLFGKILKFNASQIQWPKVKEDMYCK